MCPYCGQHGCDCEEVPLDDRIPWSGEPAGFKEARKFGLWCKIVEVQGRVTCGSDDPEALPDLAALSTDYRWSREDKTFVQKSWD